MANNTHTHYYFYGEKAVLAPRRQRGCSSSRLRGAADECSLWDDDDDDDGDSSKQDTLAVYTLFDGRLMSLSCHTTLTHTTSHVHNARPTRTPVIEEELLMALFESMA